MKCEFCGGDLSLEAERCPYCGQINKHAQQHIRDMKRYHGEFEDTKRGVYSVAKRYSEVAVRFIIIGILAVLMIIMLVIYNNAYSMRRIFMQQDAKQHVEEYSEILDGYLAEEKFREFDMFCTEKFIDRYFDDGEYDQFQPVIRAVGSYLDVRESLMRLIGAEEEEQKTTYIRNLCSNISYFYGYIDLEKYSYYEGADREENIKAIETMESNVQAMLRTYCNLTEEEALSLKDLSEAKRTVLIEEKLGNE